MNAEVFGIRIRIRPDPKLFGLKDPAPDPDPPLLHTKQMLHIKRGHHLNLFYFEVLPGLQQKQQIFKELFTVPPRSLLDPGSGIGKNLDPG